MNCYYGAVKNVQSGLEVFLSSLPRSLKDQRIGVLCHQASVDSSLRHILPLLKARDLKITALYAPEHGLWGTAQDQVPISSDVQRPTSDVARPTTIPIYSLYGDKRAPTQEMLAPIDILLCDLQDVGSRYYTFIWTMALAMQACAKFRKKFIVLDRPNPIDGVTLEGPVLDPAFASFVGLYPIPVRHGMTIGEIALWVNEGLGIGADLDVIAMKGWKRHLYFEETGLPWVLPSPNMPTMDTALVYPGACLLEGTHLSEGRGTTHPFEMIGAPYIEADLLRATLQAMRLPGVLFRSCRFEPTFHKFWGESCGGIQMHVQNRKAFSSFLTTLQVIQTIHELYPTHFAWRDPPYEYETVKLPFDILCGTDRVRQAIESGASVKTLEPEWIAQCRDFSRQRKPFLLYN